jgi:hypothetical protein
MIEQGNNDLSLLYQDNMSAILLKTNEGRAVLSGPSTLR